MAQPKRGLPSLSPPRPKTAGKSTTSSNTKSKSKSTTKSRTSTGSTKAKSGSKVTKPSARKTSAKPRTTNNKNRLFADMPIADDDHDEDENDHDDEQENDSDAESPSISPSSNHPSSPSRSPSPSMDEQNPEDKEPDFILAEISTSNFNPTTGGQDAAIPSGLMHRILHHHWKTGDKTRITADARETVGKYVDVFVREAVMRAAYEKGERDRGVGEEVGAEIGIGGDGWLEVEDLERVAVTLCFDF